MKESWLRTRRRWVVVIVILPLFLGVLALIGRATPATAAVLPVGNPVSDFQKPDNSACLACHGKAGQTWKLPGGEVLSISVDPTMYDGSVHKSFSCSTCHVSISSYPHPKNAAQSIADFRTQFKENCNTCHKEESSALMDSAHTLLEKKGNKNTPICVDCHYAHTQVKIKKTASGSPTFEEKATIAKICAQCHNGIYNQYIDSVHGEGVLVKNPDVPACNDCHGIHTITDARSVQFRLRSPEMCSKCHTDASVMNKYGITTDVLSTYVADFHGTTVTLFEKQSPDQQTNKPVCFDCHGVHNIAKVNDPAHGLQIETNLLQACQKCHPDATINFPSSWLSHYNPSPQKAPLVFFVNLFYYILIPTVLGGMAIIVLTDVIHKVRVRRKPAQSASKEI